MNEVAFHHQSLERAELEAVSLTGRNVVANTVMAVGIGVIGHAFLEAVVGAPFGNGSRGKGKTKEDRVKTHGFRDDEKSRGLELVSNCIYCDNLPAYLWTRFVVD